MTSDVSFDRPRRLPRGTFDIAPSCLGFGCASLGSRIGAKTGLRAIHAAYEAGVTWFDVAPAYGAGEAETILAPFVAAHRDTILLTTKVGLAPPARSAAMRLATVLARPALGALGGLRRAVRRTGATANARLPLDGALVARSIEASLQRLKTDRVDTFALHDPTPADLARDDVLRALEDARARGQARHIGVAGDAEACRMAGVIGAPFTLVQMSAETFARPSCENASRAVLHSVFGVAGRRDRLVAALAASPDKLSRLEAAGYAGGLKQAASDLLIDAAFAANPDGIVLASMFDPAHLARNVARAARLRPEAPTLLADMLG